MPCLCCLQQCCCPALPDNSTGEEEAQAPPRTGLLPLPAAGGTATAGGKTEAAVPGRQAEGGRDEGQEKIPTLLNSLQPPTIPHIIHKPASFIPVFTALVPCNEILPDGDVTAVYHMQVPHTRTCTNNEEWWYSLASSWGWGLAARLLGLEIGIFKQRQYIWSVLFPVGQASANELLQEGKQVGSRLGEHPVRGDGIHTLASGLTGGLAGKGTSLALRMVFCSRMSACDRLCPYGWRREDN